MATLSNITLLFSSGTGGKTNVTVSGTRTFDASEVGKIYLMEIKIFGEDKTGDKLPSGDSLVDDDIYTFKWGSLFLQKKYQQFTVAVDGSQPFTETRSISDDILDEDKGMVKIGEADINTPIFAPRADEVYAKVSLSGKTVSALSATIKSFGV